MKKNPKNIYHTILILFHKCVYFFVLESVTLQTFGPFILKMTEFMSWASFWNLLGSCDRMIPSPTLYITNKVSFSSSESIKKTNRYIIIKEHKNTTIVISIWWQLKSGKILYQTLLNMLDPKQQHRPFFCDSGKIYWGVCKSKREFSCTHYNINYHMWTEMLIETKLTVQFFCHTQKVCWDR